MVIVLECLEEWPLSVFVLCLWLTSFCLHSKMDFQFPFVLRPPESMQIKPKWETVLLFFYFCCFMRPLGCLSDLEKKQ